MDSFPADIAFRKTWRTYQARVLSELERYLDDNHLHVIAAPGSGKTVLGLEVARRLKRATLIFSPTIAIRDQWVERLVGLFSEPGRGVPDWISKDINKPGHLTVSTYQGLHSAWLGRAEAEEDGEEEEAESEAARGSGAGGEKGLGRERLLQKLREAGVGTLVLDEAHHLRNEWWKCLIGVKEALEGPTVVALTATPPFDVTEYEWRRYTDLCGPVDSEISVPELVLERNLCPHQDYVFLSRPLRTEKAEIDEFRSEVGKLVEGIFADGQFAELLASHRCVRRPKAHVEEILADPGFYSSMAFFLNHVTGRAPKDLLRLIGISPRACPKRNSQWVEELLTGCLYSHRESFGDGREVFARIGRDLKRIGAIERRKVRLESTSRITKLLASSVSKLESVERIVELESGLLSGELRMVILTDFIRRPDLPSNVGDIKALKRIGVVPIFEQIRRSSVGDIKLGILSGTLVVIPSVSRRLLEEIAAGMSIEASDIRYTPLAHDDSFVEVGISGADRQKMVRLITRLFGRGGVTVLVGTKSLLGEGWDAPSINSLVLASFVGS
ncbi:MAG: DEAD/DEAH box helicase family protein, partial [Phycisphaerales bacterium]